MIAAIVLLVLAVLGVLGLWLVGHPAVIDRPGPHPFWDRHSPGHLIGSLVLSFVLCGLGTAAFAFSGTLLVGLLIELAQGHPRDKRGGHFGWEDLAVDFLGIVGGLLLCAAF